MKINDVTVPQPETKKYYIWKCLKSQQQLRDETGGFPAKARQHTGSNPFTLSRGWVSSQGWQSPLHFTHSLFPDSKPNPQLMPIAYRKDQPVWLLLQQHWLRQENMPKPHQATGKHEQVWSWCCPGCLWRALAVQGRPAPHLLTALHYLPCHPSHQLILLGSTSDSVY